MTRYIWKGPATAETLSMPEGTEPLDLMLKPDGEVEAPADHPLVKQWVARELLVEAPKAPLKPAKPVQGENKE